ncbi:MAG TPA: hypothetical protein VN442_18265 [Bryobacteraceae bacterium]|nr:hypothetical protein [Bryobacteraceae bacterium]
MRIDVPGVLALSVLLAAPVAAQDRPKFMEVTTVKVKPGKRGDLEAAMRKGVEANRRYKGDHWIAFDSFYGDGMTMYLLSPRATMADAEQGFGNFERAMKEAYGAALPKLYQDFGNSIESIRTELRLRRWDLSQNVPATQEEMNRMVGEARWLRMTAVEVRRPHLLEFEKFVPELLGGMQRKVPAMRTMVMQSSAGGDGGIYFYFTSLHKSLAEMDQFPNIREALGEDLFRKFLRMDGEAVVRAIPMVARIVPELSNPPEAIASVSRDFWTPKPVMAARKAKAAQ